VGELATQLSTSYGGPAPLTVGGARAADVRHVVADPTAARTTLGFTAQVPFDTGVSDFAKAPLRSSAALI
jgi:dTDP-L-rhamnose 4-epimerase